MTLKAGYKQTEVGIIPEDWEEKTLGEIGNIRMCKRILKNQTREHGDVPFYKIGTFGGSADAFISYALFNEFRRNYSFPKKGDVLISAAGTIGRSVVYDGEPAYFQDSNIVWIENNETTIINTFLWHCYQVTKWAVSHGGTVARLYNDNLRTKIHVPTPPLPEQKAIAEALGDADGLIESLEQLIAKKRAIKQGAMQELLTGKKRLSGFKARWASKTLGELGSFSKGSGIKKDQVLSDGLCCIRYGEIYTHHDDYIRKFYSYISFEVARSSQKIKTGALLFAGSGETAEEIGKCVAYLGNDAVYAGGDIVIFNPTESDSLYLAYLMNSRSLVQQKSRMAQGDAVVHISARNLASLRFDCPDINEQIAIAAVLSGMDSEISSLEEKLAKARAIKSGMMHELLTGKMRLV